MVEQSYCMWEMRHLQLNKIWLASKDDCSFCHNTTFSNILGSHSWGSARSLMLSIKRQAMRWGFPYHDVWQSPHTCAWMLRAWLSHGGRIIALSSSWDTCVFFELSCVQPCDHWLKWAWSCARLRSSCYWHVASVGTLWWLRSLTVDDLDRLTAQNHLLRRL